MNILNENNRLIDSKYIEELFTDLQLNQNVNSALNSMKKILNKSFQGTCEDIYIGNKTNDKKIYGMCVYPTVESLRELSLKIIKYDKEQSKEITKFVIVDNIRYIIEIDPNLLYSKFINFTPAELTAVLLHELGHVIYSKDSAMSGGTTLQGWGVGVSYSKGNCWAKLEYARRIGLGNNATEAAKAKQRVWFMVGMQW